MPGRLIVVSGPSGSGKTTIAHELLRRNPSLRFSVSATTRTIRSGEQNERDYNFLTREEFLRRVDDGDFIEWEHIFGDYYGTLKSEVERGLNSGGHLLFDVDVKGALAIKRQFPDALLIFVQPPSYDVLIQRLRDRHTESEDALSRRLDRVDMELGKSLAFSCRVVNDSFERVINEVQGIVDQYLSQAGQE